MITLLSKDQEEKLKGGFAEISVFPLKGSMEGQKNKKNVGCVVAKITKIVLQNVMETVLVKLL